MAIGSYPLPQLPEVLQPATPEEAWKLRATLGPSGCYVSGGTLLRTQWESGLVRMPKHLISLSRLPETQGITAGSDGLAIGASVSLAVCRKHPQIAELAALLTEACRNIAAPAVRQLATVGGNVASTVGDLLPALLAYDAELVWFDGRQRRTERLEAWLAAVKTGGGPGAAVGDRLLLQVRCGGFDHRSAGSLAFYLKVGRREAFTPSVVTVAAVGSLNPDGVVTQIRISAGGGSAIAMRLTKTEELLRQARITPALLSDVQSAVFEEYQPANDFFASAAYRKRTAANLIAAELWKAHRRAVSGEQEGGRAT
jgi:carbon-monoxide dehydrogenase medium subunit